MAKGRCRLARSAVPRRAWATSLKANVAAEAMAPGVARLIGKPPVRLLLWLALVG